MNHKLLISIILHFSIATVRTQTEVDCELVNLIDDDVHTFQSASPYVESLCLKISTVLGYKLEVTVKTIDIDGKEPLYDYLLIKPGLDLEDPGSGKVFTHILNNERSYVLFSNNAFIQFNAHLDNDGNINPNRRNGFKLTYQRIGEETITTTTEAPNLNPLPTPAGNDTIYLTVHLSGKHLFEYTQVFIEKLRVVIIQMAKAYCEFASLPIVPDDTLNTHDNVLIHSLMDCPWNWPDRDHCASMEFSVPLHMQSDYEEYQLNQTNLRNMWYHFSAEYLDMVALHDYEAPDAQKSVNIWIIVITCIVISFIVFLGVLKWLLDIVMKRRVVSLLKEVNDDNVSNGNQRLHNVKDPYDSDQDVMQPDPYQTFPQAPAYDDDDEIIYRTVDDHSQQQPDNNLVVLMGTGEYGEAYSIDI